MGDMQVLPGTVNVLAQGLTEEEVRQQMSQAHLIFHLPACPAEKMDDDMDGFESCLIRVAHGTDGQLEHDEEGRVIVYGIDGTRLAPWHELALAVNKGILQSVGLRLKQPNGLSKITFAHERVFEHRGMTVLEAVWQGHLSWVRQPWDIMCVTNEKPPRRNPFVRYKINSECVGDDYQSYHDARAKVQAAFDKYWFDSVATEPPNDPAYDMDWPAPLESEST